MLHQPDEALMHWYLVHTKPRQEKIALQNLVQQGYDCYLPLLPSEKIRQGRLRVLDEPLFPRYLFIRLGKANTSKSWTPIRSTTGVSRLVSFGAEPAKVHDGLIDAMQSHECGTQTQPLRLFNPGDAVQMTQSPFAGIEGVYQMADGERRAIVLIELMCKPVAVRVEPANLKKLG